MFKGIVEGIGIIEKIDIYTDLDKYAIRFPENMLNGIKKESSIMFNGCFLTVTSVNSNIVWFDIFEKEARKLDTFREYKVGDRVNLGTFPKFGAASGGHILSARISCVASIIEIIENEDYQQMWIQIPENFTEFLIDKDYIAVDGISLTIDTIKNNQFFISLPLKIAQNTNMKWRKKGDKVNVELSNKINANQCW
ncbi:riboflavin synthase [Aliivibrio sifiae]|uniref:Yellow fluorescent protein n=3 Tax=cellular organisms TaxID=131567 RepID=LUXY_ALIFS|nr:riboflavin synthase [Aliivibrio sifiae]P21578.1 RecName: Full=Yellow fluorescent protein; Short=YFP [Aliivibrio fischeri]AAA27544.1 yellow fluorescent protein [Aliivibrio sp. ATCC 33715]PQJ84939.1 hypothetical protein BTO22_15770 [Aliivibrio sifiae]